MDNLLEMFLSQYQILILVLVRVTGLFIISPIFSRINLQMTYKIGFSLMIALIMMNVVEGPEAPMSDILLAIEVIKELLVGFMIGFISYLFLMGITVTSQRYSSLFF